MRKNDVNNINLKIKNIDFWSENGINKGGMRIYWSADIGGGTLDIVKRKGLDGEDFESEFEEMELTAHTEYMDKEDDKTFTQKLLSLLAEKIKIAD